MANTRNRITTAQKQLADLEKRVSVLQQLTDKADGRFQDIEAWRNEARQLKSEIDGIKQQTDLLFSDIQQKKESTAKMESSIEGLVEEAEESKETFNEHSENLTKIEGKIKKFETEIIDQLGRAGSGALALAFAERQGEVEKELKRWRNILFGTTAALILVAFALFKHLSSAEEIDLQFFLKMTISLPFIYAEWFASRQYTKERFIVERYAFKAAQAKSLAAFSKTVKEIDVTDEGQARAQEFVISSVDKIYVAPKLNDEDESGLILEKALKIAKDLIK